MPVRKRIRGLSIFLVVISISTPTFAQPPKEISIAASEFSFRPAQVQVSPGEFKITVTNRGRFPHGLALMGREEKINYMESGESKSLTLKLEKDAELIFYCPQPGHRRRGMEGRLSVGGG